jgi:phage terminase large subunit-like protein
MKKRTNSKQGSVRTTKKWIRNASDERAFSQGYWFDEKRGQFVVDWIEGNCCLYEGVPIGTPFTLGDWQYECTMRLFGWVHHPDDVPSPIRRYRKASIWIPKKNGV